MLRVRNLRAGYDGLEVLHGVSLHVDAGEIVTIIGANGAGKSTLLNAVAGIVRPSSGSAAFASADITFLPAETVASRGCVLVPEGRQIFAELSVRENLLLGAYLRTRRDGRRRVERDIEEICALFPVLGERRGQTAGTLSGGEQQMLALGRALMAKPRLLLLDEPSLGLAPLIVREIFHIVVGLRELGVSILLVEQNARAALETADFGYVLETGSVVHSGPAASLAHDPRVIASYLGGKVE